MPHFWNNLLVVTASELVPDFYSSIKCLSAMIAKSNKRGYGIKRVQRGCNNTLMLVDFDSLPNHIKETLGDTRKGNHILERYYTTDKDTIKYYINFQFDDSSYLEDSHQEQYITNASMIKALLALKEDRIREILSKSGVVKNIFGILLSDAVSFNKVLKAKWHVEHTLPESDKRFRQALNDFEKNGYRSLISGKHKNDNARKVDESTIQLLNNMFSGQDYKPNYVEVANQYEGFIDGYVEVINNVTGEMYNPKEYKKLSEGTIRAYLSQWENKIGNEAKRSGDRQKLMAKFKPYHSLEQPKYAGSIISIDDRQPPFEYAKGKRVWFYNAIDLGSEAFTCCVHGKTKEGLIIDFYRQLVRNYHELGFNFPAELECESSLNSSFSNTFLQEGYMFDNVRIEANNARGKRIEAYYKPLRYEIEKKREGWLARPFARSESNQSSNEKVPFIPYESIIEGCLIDINTWNSMPHSKIKDKTRWQVFVENQNPNLKPTNYRKILPYLGYKTATSCRAGIIKLQGKEFLLGDNSKIYAGEKLINLMKTVEGQNIDIYWLDDNECNVFKAFVYIGTQYICEALPKPIYSRAIIERTPEDLEKREIMSKYVTTVDSYMNSQKKQLEKVNINHERNLTLNNNCSFFGIKKEIIPESEVEILPELQEEECELVLVENTYKSSLKERF